MPYEELPPWERTEATGDSGGFTEYENLRHRQAINEAGPRWSSTDPVERALAAPKIPNVEPGWLRIPGMSRSGAMDPAKRSKLYADEATGLIEVRRSADGQPYMYRPIDNGEGED